MSETNASAARQEPRYNVDMTAFFEGFGTKPQEGKVVDVSNRGPLPRNRGLTDPEIIRFMPAKPTEF